MLNRAPGSPRSSTWTPRPSSPRRTAVGRVVPSSSTLSDPGHEFLGGVFDRAFPLAAEPPERHEFWSWREAGERATLEKVLAFFRDSWSRFSILGDVHPDRTGGPWIRALRPADARSALDGAPAGVPGELFDLFFKTKTVESQQRRPRPPVTEPGSEPLTDYRPGARRPPRRGPGQAVREEGLGALRLPPGPCHRATRARRGRRVPAHGRPHSGPLQRPLTVLGSGPGPDHPPRRVRRLRAAHESGPSRPRRLILAPIRDRAAGHGRGWAAPRAPVGSDAGVVVGGGPGGGPGCAAAGGRVPTGPRPQREP